VLWPPVSRCQFLQKVNFAPESSYFLAQNSGRNIFGLSASLQGLVRERRARA
jgi:hypothetical protein